MKEEFERMLEEINLKMDAGYASGDHLDDLMEMRDWLKGMIANFCE